MIKPHNFFSFYRADAVAECWDDVPDALYRTLWDDIVPIQEDLGEFPEVGVAALSDYWHLLSETDQTLLNTLAANIEAEWEQIDELEEKEEWDETGDIPY
jgi:hypothetical protein